MVRLLAGHWAEMTDNWLVVEWAGWRAVLWDAHLVVAMVGQMVWLTADLWAARKVDQSADSLAGLTEV